MFHRNIKLILAALIIIAGIWQFTESNIGNGIFLLFLSAFPIFLYYKNEFILLAFLKLRKQDFPGAQIWLENNKDTLITFTGLWFLKPISTKLKSSSKKLLNLDFPWIWIWP